MNATDQGKCLNAGFTIIRAEGLFGEGTLRIKAKTKEQREWHNLETGFATKAALKRKMDQLLKISTIIED